MKSKDQREIKDKTKQCPSDAEHKSQISAVLLNQATAACTELHTEEQQCFLCLFTWLQTVVTVSWHAFPLSLTHLLSLSWYSGRSLRSWKDGVTLLLSFTTLEYSAGYGFIISHWYWISTHYQQRPTAKDPDQVWPGSGWIPALIPSRQNETGF